MKDDSITLVGFSSVAYLTSKVLPDESNSLTFVQKLLTYNHLVTSSMRNILSRKRFTGTHDSQYSIRKILTREKDSMAAPNKKVFIQKDSHRRKKKQ